uniref:Ribosomal protein L7/L12 C-terminal domain-containing protein n=1 Tax=Alexandrium andersonii TaxID=327968 RepID=A0A7S2IU39_9DINO
MARYAAPRRSAHLTPLAPALLVVGLLGLALQWSASTDGAAQAPMRLPSAAFVSGLPRSRAGARAVRVGMQSETTDKIVEELKTLTLLEASELVKAIEETFGVDASASAGAVMMAAPAAGDGEEEKAAEKTEFDLILKEVPKDKKIAILKVVRGILGVGLKEAKGMVDNPGTIMEGKPKDICDDAKTQLEEAGAVVEIK